MTIKLFSDYLSLKDEETLFRIITAKEDEFYLENMKLFFKKHNLSFELLKDHYVKVIKSSGLVTFPTYETIHHPFYHALMSNNITLLKILSQYEIDLDNTYANLTLPHENFQNREELKKSPYDSKISVMISVQCLSNATDNTFIEFFFYNFQKQILKSHILIMFISKVMDGFLNKVNKKNENIINNILEHNLLHLSHHDEIPDSMILKNKQNLLSSHPQYISLLKNNQYFDFNDFSNLSLIFKTSTLKTINNLKHVISLADNAPEMIEKMSVYANKMFSDPLLSLSRNGVFDKKDNNYLNYPTLLMIKYKRADCLLYLIEHFNYKLNQFEKDSLKSLLYKRIPEKDKAKIKELLKPSLLESLFFMVSSNKDKEVETFLTSLNKQNKEILNNEITEQQNKTAYPATINKIDNNVPGVFNTPMIQAIYNNNINMILILLNHDYPAIDQEIKLVDYVYKKNYNSPDIAEITNKLIGKPYFKAKDFILSCLAHQKLNTYSSSYIYDLLKKDFDINNSCYTYNQKELQIIAGVFKNMHITKIPIFSFLFEHHPYVLQDNPYLNKNDFYVAYKDYIIEHIYSLMYISTYNIKHSHDNYNAFSAMVSLLIIDRLTESLIHNNFITPKEATLDLYVVRNNYIKENINSFDRMEKEDKESLLQRMEQYIIKLEKKLILSSLKEENIPQNESKSKRL